MAAEVDDDTDDDAEFCEGDEAKPACTLFRNRLLAEVVMRAYGEGRTGAY